MQQPQPEKINLRLHGFTRNVILRKLTLSATSKTLKPIFSIYAIDTLLYFDSEQSKF